MNKCKEVPVPRHAPTPGWGSGVQPLLSEPALQAPSGPPLHILQAVAPEAAQLSCGASTYPVP